VTLLSTTVKHAFVLVTSSLVLMACANKDFLIDGQKNKAEGEQAIFSQQKGKDAYPLPELAAEEKNFAVYLPPAQANIDDNSTEFYESGLAVDGNQVTLLRLDRSLEDVWATLVKNLDKNGVEILREDSSINELIVHLPQWDKDKTTVFWWQKTAVVLDIVAVSGATQISFWDDTDEVADPELANQVIAKIAELFELELELDLEP
jgi:hypothetical protein